MAVKPEPTPPGPPGAPHNDHHRQTKPHATPTPALRRFATALACCLTATAAVISQKPTDQVGTGAQAWSYLIVEGEGFDSKSHPSPDLGVVKADSSASITSSQGNPVLAKTTTASGKGALFTRTAFSAHIDKVTYKVQFTTPGTYYLYMRFTMFENGGNLTHYLNEDSFFLPPDWGKDPQTDWPLSDRGGYAEGCCGKGFLTILENGTPVNHSGGDEAGRAYWEGNFHWNHLGSSQFLNAETQGDPGVRFKYVVTQAQVGKPLDWTISYREGGLTVDLWLFSTHPDLIGTYSQADLDRLLLGSAASPSLAIRRKGNSVVLSWPTSAAGFALESTASLPTPRLVRRGQCPGRCRRPEHRDRRSRFRAALLSPEEALNRG